MKVRQFDQITPEWLTDVLKAPVSTLEIRIEESTWAKHAVILAQLEDGTQRKLWFKLCLHDRFGRSEVDYYLRDYVDLPGAPLLRCYNACHEPGVGYQILLEDLSDEYQDRKHVPPTREHGIAIAKAMALMHTHYWESTSPKPESEWETQLAELRKGVTALEQHTGNSYSERFEIQAKKIQARWSQPMGLTMLHGDVNPTNVLTPKSADSPVYFLDRQPLDGKTIYGLAAYDLAYAIVPWWTKDLRKAHEEEILRCWYEALNQPSYPWDLAVDDWNLSVEHCLHIPINWCIDPTEAESMRGLWEWQLKNIDG